MYKNGIKPPTISEVIAMADMFDFMGDYDSAELMDEFIEKSAESNGSIEKQAGFWSDIWGRMKGKAKTWFISEYKELHNAAKESQDKLDMVMSKINESYKDIKQDFKNYELSNWRFKLQKLGLSNIDEILGPYDKVYSRFLQYVEKFKDMGEEEKDLSKLTPSERAEHVTKDPTLSKWKRAFGIMGIEQNIEDKNKIRMTHYYFKKSEQPESRKGRGTIHWDHKSGLVWITENADTNIKRALGNDNWKIYGQDDDYVYLERHSQRSEKELTTQKPESDVIKSKPEEAKSEEFTAPSLSGIPTEKLVSEPKEEKESGEMLTETAKEIAEPERSAKSEKPKVITFPQRQWVKVISGGDFNRRVSSYRRKYGEDPQGVYAKVKNFNSNNHQFIEESLQDELDRTAKIRGVEFELTVGKFAPLGSKSAEGSATASRIDELFSLLKKG